MRLKLLIIFVTLLMCKAIYAQDKIHLKSGELHGYITLVTDSIIKFKTSIEDKSEFTFKRKDILSYAYAPPVIDTTDYKHFYIVKNNKDTLMRYAVGDVLIYQLMGQCAEEPQDGKIIKIRNDRILLAYEKSIFKELEQKEVMLNYICYITNRSIGSEAVKTTLMVTGGLVGGLIAGSIESHTIKVYSMDKGIKMVAGK
jgi:preprotein translocase subunit YajC